MYSAKVDISELTWEEKEKVLRLLFAKMNGLKTRYLTGVNYLLIISYLDTFIQSDIQFIRLSC